MHRFFSILHSRKSSPSDDQVSIAEGILKVFETRAELLKYLDTLAGSVERQQTLQETLTRSAERKLVSVLLLVFQIFSSSNVRLGQMGSVNIRDTPNRVACQL
jgi:hypothetical protein